MPIMTERAMREPTTDTTEEDISEVELRRRVLFSMLGPVVRLADHFGISLRELTEWVRLAYFKDQRERGMSLSQISDKLDVSERTSKTLSRQLLPVIVGEHGLHARAAFGVLDPMIAAAAMGASVPAGAAGAWPGRRRSGAAPAPARPL